ncbi:MAG: DNA replication/repair protein RecF [Peptococcaceae bacterium]|nr:DNA replication/repair protein RecF [Peptococcaceae bacterium]
MQITSLELKDYRNYLNMNAEFCPGINLFYGANGQGKTNLIEAIYYLSIGKAYRPVRDEQLILWGKEEFRISAGIENRRGGARLQASYKKNEKPAKSFFAGGLRLTKTEELSGLFTSVLFSPDSISIIKGAPQERRSFLDYDISQISLSYVRDLNKYKRLLAQRNALLKKFPGYRGGPAEKNAQLELWDRQLVDCGARLIEKRLSVMEKLNPLTRLTQRRLTAGQENIELHYIFNKSRRLEESDCRKTGKIAEYLWQAREGALEEDLRFGITQWGPHRDDLEILLNGINLKQFGSQGQQRTAVLALKLAELEFFRGESGEYPVLLLDDVLSELDENRQNQLLTFIQEKAIQCFITSTEPANFSGREKRQSRSFLVIGGKIEKN